MQPQFLRLSPLGLALGSAAAMLVAIVVRILTFGLGFGYRMRGPYMHGPYGMGGGMPVHGGFAGFALLAAIGAIVFAGVLGAIIAWVYNAAITPRRQPPTA